MTAVQEAETNVSESFNSIPVSLSVYGKKCEDLSAEEVLDIVEHTMSPHFFLKFLNDDKRTILEWVESAVYAHRDGLEKSTNLYPIVSRIFTEAQVRNQLGDPDYFGVLKALLSLDNEYMALHAFIGMKGYAHRSIPRSYESVGQGLEARKQFQTEFSNFMRLGQYALSCDHGHYKRGNYLAKILFDLNRYRLGDPGYDKLLENSDYVDGEKVLENFHENAGDHSKSKSLTSRLVERGRRLVLGGGK